MMCGPHFCSMKITQDVREYAAQIEVSETEALERGMEEKALEFRQAGAATRTASTEELICWPKLDGARLIS